MSVTRRSVLIAIIIFFLITIAVGVIWNFFLKPIHFSDIPQNHRIFENGQPYFLGIRQSDVTEISGIIRSKRLVNDTLTVTLDTPSTVGIPLRLNLQYPAQQTHSVMEVEEGYKVDGSVYETVETGALYELLTVGDQVVVLVTPPIIFSDLSRLEVYKSAFFPLSFQRVAWTIVRK